MTSNESRYAFLQLPTLTLNESVIPILLTTYKYGIAELPSDFGLLKTLASIGFAKTSLARGHSLCTLTETGATWVTNHLFNILTECPLHLSYAALVSRDEIQLMKDLVKPTMYNSPGFIGPAGTMDRGRYFLQKISHSRVTLVDDCEVPYTMSLQVAQEMLKFRPDQLTTIDDELKKRFHKIRIKSLVKRLAPMVNTLTLTEWVEELYNKSYTKWRMGD